MLLGGLKGLSRGQWGYDGDERYFFQGWLRTFQNPLIVNSIGDTVSIARRLGQGIATNMHENDAGAFSSAIIVP